MVKAKDWARSLHIGQLVMFSFLAAGVAMVRDVVPKYKLIT